MARAYSPDLRERVIVAVASGQSRRRVATTFRVEPSTVVKWWRRYRSTGEVAARRRGGSKVRALVDERDWVLERVAEPQYLRYPTPARGCCCL
jgi:transposase